MRESGQYVPRWAVREAWASGVKAISDADLMNRLGDTFVPPQSRHDERPTWKTQEEWLYRVKITGPDLFTGQQLSQFVTVENKDRLSIGEIKASALGTIGNYNFDPFAGEIEAEVTEFIHAGGIEE
jgi:hypothetical protein